MGNANNAIQMETLNSYFLCKRMDFLLYEFTSLDEKLLNLS